MLLWPIVAYFFLVVLVVAVMIGLSRVLGERHQERATGEPYESGVMVTSSARLRLSPQFYLVAMFFVIFDLESVFVFTWAVAATEARWSGYFEIVIFVGVLLAAIVYLWRIGALDWAPTPMMLRSLRRARRRVP